MSGLWVLEETNGTGEPILDLWEPKSGHFRFRPYTLLWGEAGEGGGDLFFRCCASQGRCLLHTWWMSNMSRFWVPEEREGTGEPILDIWEQKSGHLRSVKCNGHTDFRCFERFWAYVTRDIYV